MKFVKAQIVLEYKDFYNQDPPLERLSLVKHISKFHLLTEISALNYRLKPNNVHSVDVSSKTQLRELKYITKTSRNYEHYFKTYEFNCGGNNIRTSYPAIFTRQTCLFALEEVINSDALERSDDAGFRNIGDWDALFAYLMAVNSFLGDVKEDNDVSIENTNAKLIAYNELSVDVDLVYTLYRGLLLMQFLHNLDEYRLQIEKYFYNTYSLTFSEFVVKLVRIYFSNETDHKFFYYVSSEDEKLFNDMSKRTYNADILKLVGIRKSPFFKVDQDKFILTDMSLLIEKAYSQFINDFWFDNLKEALDGSGKKTYNIYSYRGNIGRFFEEYVSNIVKSIFMNCKYCNVFTLDELKFQSSIGEIELSDFFVRDGKRIIIGEIKGGSIYDDQKYGGDVSTLYKNDREKFFKNFGVDQVIASIKNLDKYITQIDPKHPINNAREIYPCIVLNDKIFQTPLMANIFNERFEELKKGITVKKLVIKPLTIIYINELERMQKLLSDNPKKIWSILKSHTSSNKIIFSLYNTLRKLRMSYMPPREIISYIINPNENT